MNRAGTFVAGIALGVALVSTAASAETYKAVRDFSYLNPSGVWSYGFGKTGTTFNRIAKITDACSGNEEDCFHHDAVVIGINTAGVPFADKGSSTALIGDNVITMHPDPAVDAIVSFRAPRNGIYKVTGSFQVMDTAPTGVAPLIFIGRKDITLAAFRASSRVVLSGPPANRETKKGGGKLKFAFTQRLDAGQVVFFGLNGDGNATFDSTAFEAEVQIGDP